MKYIVQTSIAFDPKGERDPERDDWHVEDCGEIPESVLEQFEKAHFAKAIRFIRLTKSQSAALVTKWDKVYSSFAETL